MARYWWVNQGNTYQVQREGGHLFASSASGFDRAVPSWEALKDMAPGDVVFHYAKGALRALGRVTEPAISAPHPAGEEAGAERNADLGYKVTVDYTDIDPAIPLDDIPLDVRARGPFAKGEKVVGTPNQQYAIPLHESFVYDLRKALLDRLPFDPW